LEVVAFFLQQALMVLALTLTVPTSQFSVHISPLKFSHVADDSDEEDFMDTLTPPEG
jgi:hypothetical protein